MTVPSKALFQDHDPLEPAVPLSHQQSAGLQADALSRLSRAAVERSADAILCCRAKDPSDRLSRSLNASDCSRYASTFIRSQRGRWLGGSPPKWARH